jgi:hypothetical protein
MLSNTLKKLCQYINVIGINTSIIENSKVVINSLFLFIGKEYIKSTLIFFILNENSIIGITLAKIAANIVANNTGGVSI